MEKRSPPVVAEFARTRIPSFSLQRSTFNVPLCSLLFSPCSPLPPPVPTAIGATQLFTNLRNRLRLNWFDRDLDFCDSVIGATHIWKCPFSGPFVNMPAAICATQFHARPSKIPSFSHFDGIDRHGQSRICATRLSLGFSIGQTGTPLNRDRRDPDSTRTLQPTLA